MLSNSHTKGDLLKHDPIRHKKRSDESLRLHEEALRLFKKIGIPTENNVDEVFHKRSFKEALYKLNRHIDETESEIRKEKYGNVRDATEIDKKLLGAVTESNTGLVQKYIDERADVNSLFQKEFNDGTGNPLLFEALKNLNKTHKKISLDTVRILLKNNLNTNIIDVNENPLINILIIKKYGVEYLKLLIECGKTRIDVDDGSGVTPFMAASFVADFESMEYLIGKGADINATDNFGMSALHHAVDSNNLKNITFLIDKGVKLFNKNEFYEFCNDMFFVNEDTEELYLKLLENSKQKI